MVLDRMLADRTACSQPGEKQAMIDLASQYDDVISLGRGDPDLAPPKLVVDSATEAMKQPTIGYTKWPGLPKLRKAIAKRYTEVKQVPVEPGEVLVTVGAQEAVFLTMLSFINQGDEIIMSEPRYTPYDIAIHLVGGTLVSLPTSEADNFIARPEDVEAAVTDRTKALLLVSPNNPTGSVIPRETLEAYADVAKRRNLMVISDELYSDLAYDGEPVPSIASIPGMKERTVIINGFSKSYSMTGWRVGYLIASAHSVKIMTEMKSALTICAPNISQHAALAAIEQGEDEIRNIVETYDERRRYMMGALDDLGLTYIRPKGAFYVFANITPLLQPGETSFDFTRRFLMEKQVLIFPGTIFGASGEGYVRISLLQSTGMLREAMERLSAYIKEQRGA